MSDEEEKKIYVDPDKWARFERFEQDQKSNRSPPEKVLVSKKEEIKDAEEAEKPAWRCTSCGEYLAPADWGELRLTRTYPSGCPACGGTKAEIE